MARPRLTSRADRGRERSSWAASDPGDPQYFPKNALGKVTRTTDPLGRTRIYNYAANGIDLLEIRQVNGQATDLLASYSYNGQHKRLTKSDASGQTWSYTYNAAGQPLTMTTPLRNGITENRTATYSHDTNGYVQAVTGPATGATTTYGYDGYGRILTVTDSESATVTYDYDALDRPTKLTYPDGTYEQTTWEKLDAGQTRDRLGRWTRLFHDALRHTVAVRDPLGRTTTYQWCNCGSLDKVIDPNSNTRTFNRDLQGRLTSEVRADGSATSFTYENTTSRLLQRTDAKNQTSGYQYFLDNNLKQITYTNAEHSTPNVTFSYDPVYPRPLSMTDGVGTTTYSYKPVTMPPSLGAARFASVDGPLSNDTIAYGYDEVGRSVNRSINGAALVQTFDALGRITGETNALGTSSYTYVGVTGRPSTATYPNGQTTTLDYFDNSGDHHLKEIWNKLSGGATLSKFDYTRDATGRLKSWSQQADANPAKTYTFEFDPGDEVTAATLRDASSNVLKSYDYAYDQAGNRTTEAIDSAAVASTFNNVNHVSSQQVGGALRLAGTVNEPATVTVGGKPGQVTSNNSFEGLVPVTSGANSVAVVATDPSGNTRTNTYQVSVTGTGGSFSYDGNGNLATDGVRAFEWDAENRLTAVSQGTSRSEFTYDGLSRRVRIVEKTSGTVTNDHSFVWCGLRICEERDTGTSAVTRRFFNQGVQDGGTNYFYTGDNLRSIREMTDATGAIRARYDYDPYGRRTKLSGDKDAAFGFTGHYFHAPTGLTLAPYRAYDAGLGRWLSEDPAGLDAGDTNLYRYAVNRPTDLVDPSGGQVVETVVTVEAVDWWIGAAIAGGAMAGVDQPPPVPPFPGNVAPPAPLPPSTPVPQPAPPPGPPPGGPPPAATPPAVPPPAMPIAPPAQPPGSITQPSGPVCLPFEPYDPFLACLMARVQCIKAGSGIPNPILRAGWNTLCWVGWLVCIANP